jgi:hypothetical protein
MKIILNAKLRVINQNEKYELHHILPKSLFPLWKERKSNLVYLTLREHYFVHQLLSKIYGGKMMNALWFMTHIEKYKICTSKEYEKMRKFRSEKMSELGKIWGKRNKGRKRTEEYIKWFSERNKGENNPNYNHRWNDSQRLRQSLQRKGNKNCVGRVYTEETKRKMSETAKVERLGKHWYHKDDIESFQRECPEGFEPGRCQRMKTITRQNFFVGSHKERPKRNTFFFTNGTVNLLAKECPEGFVKGITRNKDKK